MEKKTSSLRLTILACCVLHNICIIVGDPSTIDPVEDDHEDEDSFNGDMQLGASDIRDNIIQYLSLPKTKMEVLFYCYFQKYTFLLGISRAKNLLCFPLLCKYVFVKNCYCYLSNVKIETIFLLVHLPN